MNESKECHGDGIGQPAITFCGGCEWFTAGGTCGFGDDGACAFPWVFTEHECPRCHKSLEINTWCPDCKDGWAWPVGGRK